MSGPLKNWSKEVIKELIKHADRDNCYQCKQLIATLAAAYGMTPETFKKNNWQEAKTRQKKMNLT